METDIIKQYIIQEDNIVIFDNETYLVKPLFNSKDVESYVSIAKKGAANCYIYLRLCSDTVPAKKKLILKCSTPDLELCSKMERVPVFNQKAGKYVSRFRIKATVENVYDIIHAKAVSLSWDQNKIKAKTSLDDSLLTGFFIQTRGLSCIPESQQEVIDAAERKAKELQEEERKKKMEEEEQKRLAAEKEKEQQQAKQLKDINAPEAFTDNKTNLVEKERPLVNDEENEIQLNKDVKDFVKGLWSDLNNNLETRRTDLYYIRQYYKAVKDYYLYYNGVHTIILKKLGLNQEYIVKQLELLKQRGLIDYDLGIVIRVTPPNFYKNCSLQQLFDVIDQKTSVKDLNNRKGNHREESASQTSSTTNSGCYIATCVYGSYDCPEVWTLRRFRDQSLRNSWLGRVFIKAYYATSPTLVKWFGGMETFRAVNRRILDKMVSNLNRKGFENKPYKDR